MPDSSPDLPPVGELVRFTTKASGEVVGSYFNGLFYSGTSNDCWSAQYVTAWSRVLVLPDSDEIRRTLETVIAEHVFGIDYPVDEAGCCAEVMMAALREAAIR